MQDHRPIGSLRLIDPEDRLVTELGRLEPVNPPRDPADLRRRLAADRLLYVLDVDDEPAVALWVALTTTVPVHLDEVIGEHVPVLDPELADVAVFHSVWNIPGRPAVTGAARSTIESAIADLDRRHPRVRTAVTISPLPGLRSWIEGRGVEVPPPSRELDDLAATYLRSLDEGVPIDPVARFHLGNGARLLRILPGADNSALGLERSFGVMANYRYVPEDRAANRRSLAAGVVVDSTAATE